VVKNNAWNSQQSPNHVYDAYSIPSRIRFTGQPAEAQTLRLSYWPLSDVNNITELDMAAEGTSGVFSTNVPGALLSGDYGYDAKAFDAQGEVLNHLTGTFSVVNGTTSTTVTGVPLQTGSLQIPHTYIAYDTFGNATANKDALGNYSYKVYDPLGRVKYEIDAERYLTEYSYDAFGNQKTLTRYAKALTEGLFSAKETASNAGNITGFNMDDVQNLLNVWTQDFSTDASGLTALPDPYFTLENGQLKVTSQSAATEGWPQVTGIPRAFDSGLLFHSEINTNSPSYGRVLLIGADNAWSNGVYRRHAAYFENGLLFASFYDPTNPDPWQKAPLSNAAKPLEDNTTYVVEVQTHEGGTTLYVYEKGADRATGWTHALSGASWHTDWNAAETFIQTYVGPGQPTSAVYVDNLSETYASIEDRTLTNTYDQLNQLIETKQQAVLVYDRATGLRPQSPTTQYQYDSNGNVVLTTDPNGNKTYSYYDKTGNKILQADPLGYVTAWEYDGNGNITRQSQYASALSAATRASLSVNSDSEALKTEVVNASNPDDRVVIYGYDRLNRKLQETLLDISFAGVNASTGALNEMNGSATTSYDYDGLGNLLYRTAPNGGFTSYSYDGLSRLTAETGQGYNDHLGAYVQGTMLTAYDGLGNVTTVTRQGNAAQGLADQVTQYFYDPQGNRTKEIDPEGNPVTYYYDLNGNITVKHTRRTNPDGTQPAVDTLYTYDKLNRQATTEDAKNFVYNATYNAFGEIVAKGLNDLDQEYYEYDQAGRLVKTNKDDGINRAYLYDASGNETANIQSADKDTNGNTNTTGIDLRPLTINQIAALSNTAVQRTESDYDARNQLTKTYQAPMEFISDAGGGVQEVWLNVLNNPYVGGSISSIGGTVNFAFHQYNSPRESNRYELLVDITWPPILGYGDGNIKIVWNTYTDPGTITRYAGPQDTGITINADATPNDNQALNNTYNYAIWVYKQTSYGDVLIASASRMNAWNNQQAPSYVYDSAQVPKQINFTGQSTSAQSMQLWIWPVNGTKPATPASVPMRTTSTGTPVTGHFIYDWSSLAPGNYKYEFKTFGAQGQLEYIRGEIALGSGSTATIKEQYTVQALPVSGTTFSNTIDRAQGYNAFGEIVSETDGRGYTTNFSYNKLGLLIKKEDPLTDATLENGAIVSLRPTTQYYYNKMGWTTGMRDANGKRGPPVGRLPGGGHR
jgi:YD repeat-containing protein